MTVVASFWVDWGGIAVGLEVGGAEAIAKRTLSAAARASCSFAVTWRS